MKFFLLSLLFVGTVFFSSYAQSPVLLLNYKKLQSLQAEYKKTGKIAKPYSLSFKGIIRHADEALASGNYSVMDKDQLPPGGDKHDYLSLGRYYWPDPAKPDGLPYILKDGEVNPETADISDKKFFKQMMNETFYLSLAFFITGDTKYSQRAEEIFSTWMINPATKMNPNLNSAQIKKGHTGLLYSGIIDAADMDMAIEAAALLKNANGISEKGFNGVKSWFTEYFKWMTTSKSGMREGKSTNNHGSWYDVQVVSLALFLGENDFAKKVCEEAKEKRYKHEIEPDGQQPEETRRTVSLNYSCFNIEALAKLAQLAEHVQVDLWNYKSEGRGSLKTALEYLLPYLTNEKVWDYKQIKTFKIESYVEAFVWASEKYIDAKYADVARKMLDKDYEKSMKFICY